MALLASSSLAWKPESCAVTQSVRGYWQPAWSWPKCSLQCSQPRRETGGCLVHLSWVPWSMHTTCARGDPALQQKTASQTAEWVGKLGAVMGNRCSSGHAGLHLQGVRILGLHCLFLPLQKAVPSCRLAHQAWRHLNTPPQPCDNPTAKMTSSARLRVHISGYALQIQLEGLENVQGSACLGTNIGRLRGGLKLPLGAPKDVRYQKDS